MEGAYDIHKSHLILTYYTHRRETISILHWGKEFTNTQKLLNPRLFSKTHLVHTQIEQNLRSRAVVRSPQQNSLRKNTWFLWNSCVHLQIKCWLKGKSFLFEAKLISSKPKNLSAQQTLAQCPDTYPKMRGIYKCIESINIKYIKLNI